MNDIYGIILNDAERLEGKMLEHEMFLREHPEIGFELNETFKYVDGVLTSLGIKHEKCGRCGICAEICGKGSGKIFLLRADMDALGGVGSRGESMHACGHHMHTAMLLGAAEILVSHTELFDGCIRLMFQAAEETLEGAEDMIEHGILDRGTPIGGMMLHVVSGAELGVGEIVIPSGGVNAPGADFFTITVKGRSTHGAFPQNGIDPILASAHLLLALCSIGERETGLCEKILLTFGKIEGGDSANVIPDRVLLGGSMRSFDESVRAMAKRRICEISALTAKAYGAEAEVDFVSGCPSLVCDRELACELFSNLSEVLGTEKVHHAEELPSLNMSGASEDFAYISQRIPALTVLIGAGDIRDGYTAPLHNSGVRFDTRALRVGAAVYATSALAALK